MLVCPLLIFFIKYPNGIPKLTLAFSHGFLTLFTQTRLFDEIFALSEVLLPRFSPSSELKATLQSVMRRQHAVKPRENVHEKRERHCTAIRVKLFCVLECWVA